MADTTESNEIVDINDDGKEFEEWSDQMCIQISMEDTFPAIVIDTAVQKGIISRFLNFYLSGKISKGVTATDIIFAVISIMPYSLDSEEFIWEKDQYSDNGSLFYLTPEQKLNMEVKDIITKYYKQPDNENELQKNELKENDKEQNNVSSANMANGELTDETNISDSSKTDQDDENEVKEPTSSENVNTTKSTGNSLVWFRNKPFNRVLNNTKIKEFGAIENAAFCAACNKLLGNWETDRTARIYLKYVFGIVALSLMRAIVKSHQHVTKMFSTTIFRALGFSESLIAYSPPCETCVKKTFKALRKRERKTQIMFAKLVINSFILNHRYNTQTVDEHKNTGGIKNIFLFSVLAHTSDYGLDIISMLQEVASRTVNFPLIFELFNVEETAVSWYRVDEFFKKYMCRSSYRPTCHWARVIDPEKFKHLSCENNFELAVVVAVFIEKLSENQGMWNARWVKSGENLEMYKQLGHKIYANYQEKIPELVCGGKDMLDFIKGLLNQSNDANDAIQ